MRVAVLGAGVAGLDGGASADAGRARGRRLRALARTRRAGRDDRRRRRRTCSSATTTTCSRATAHIAAALRARSAAGELEWRPSSVGDLRRRALHPFTTPLDLLRFKPMPPLDPSSDGPGRAVAAAAGALGRAIRVDHDRADWIEQRDGQRRPGRRSGARCCTGSSATRRTTSRWSWLWSKLRLRRQVSGEEAKQELLGYPGAASESLFVRLRDLIEERGGRVLIDRPAARLGRSEGFGSGPARPGSFRRGHDPRAFEAAGEPERYDAVIATLPQTSSPAARPGARRRGRRRVPRADAVDRVLHGALPAARARPPFTPFYWTNVADTELAVRRPDRAHEPRRRRSATAAAVSSTSRTTSRRDHELLGLDTDELLDLYEPGLRSVNPASTARWIKQRWLLREPAAQPVSPSATATAFRRSTPACPGSTSPTRRRSIPRIGGPTTRFARPRRSSGACLRSIRRGPSSGLRASRSRVPSA